LQTGQLPRGRSYPIEVTAAPAKVHPHVAAVGPTQAREHLSETNFGMFARDIARRHPVARRESDNLHATAEEKWIAGHQQGVRVLAHKCGKGRVNLADSAGF
jgi:hypothetical protein